jgi:hypothetical protein
LPLHKPMLSSRNAAVTSRICSHHHLPPPQHPACQETRLAASRGGHTSPPNRAPEGTHWEQAGCRRDASQHLVALLHAWQLEAARSATPGRCVTGTSITVMPDSSATSTPPVATSCEKPSLVAVAPASRRGNHRSGGSSMEAPPTSRTSRCKILDRMSWCIVVFPCTTVHSIAWLPSSAVVQRHRDQPHWLAVVRCRAGAALPAGLLILELSAQAVGSAVSHAMDAWHAQILKLTSMRLPGAAAASHEAR